MANRDAPSRSTATDCLVLTLNMSRSFEVIHCKPHNQRTEAYGPLVFICDPSPCKCFQIFHEDNNVLTFSELLALNCHVLLSLLKKKVLKLGGMQCPGFIWSLDILFIMLFGLVQYSVIVTKYPSVQHPYDMYMIQLPQVKLFKR